MLFRSFDAAAEAAMEVAKQDVEEDGGQWDEYAQQEFEQQKAQAQQVFTESMQNGMDPGQAFGEVMRAMYGDEGDEADEGEYHEDGQHHQGGPPVGKNHFDGNCLALCGGHDRYMVEGSDDEFGVWTQDADGNDVNCDCDGYKKGDHDGGQHHEGGDHDGMTGPSPAVQEAFFTTYDQTGSFEAAFDAGESVSKEEAQQSGEYDEESWNECVQVGKDAMMAAVESGEQDPGKVFGAIAMAVDECGRGQQGDCGVFMTNDMDGSIMVSTPDGQERWLMPDDFAMNEDGSVTILREGEPDTGAIVTPPPCDDGNGTNY